MLIIITFRRTKNSEALYKSYTQTPSTSRNDSEKLLFSEIAFKDDGNHRFNLNHLKVSQEAQDLDSEQNIYIDWEVDSNESYSTTAKNSSVNINSALNKDSENGNIEENGNF